MALQVHDRLARFLLIFRRTAPGARHPAASLTLETALVLPLFLFAMYLLILPMRIMDTSRAMQEICEDVCMDAAEGYYLKELVSQKTTDQDNETQENGSGELEPVTPAAAGLAEESRSEATKRAEIIQSSLSGNALGAAAAELIRRRIHDSFVEDLESWRSSCMADGEMITLTLDYRYRLPFSVFGLESLPMSVTASRRAWIGRDGKSDGNSSSLPAEDGELVYVGKDSTRYHSSPTCHYLSNSLQAVTFDSVSALRNSSGKKYHACAVCARNAFSGTVYVMPAGTSYHTDPDCSTVRAYAHAVPKSEVEYLGPCSYCCRKAGQNGS